MGTVQFHIQLVKVCFLGSLLVVMLVLFLSTKEQWYDSECVVLDVSGERKELYY